MNQELSLWGVLFPPLLPMVVLALVVSRLLSSVLARRGLYRLVWHRALFDVSVFVVLLGALNAVWVRVTGQ